MAASICAGREIPAGGISPLFILSRIRCQSSRCSTREEAFVNPAMFKPPDAICVLWHTAQLWVRIGCTVFSKEGASAARRRVQDHSTRARIRNISFINDTPRTGPETALLTWRCDGRLKLL